MSMTVNISKLVTLLFIMMFQAGGVVLRLEKSFPAKHDLTALRSYDHSRLARQLVDIPIAIDPYHPGLYSTKVLLGSPPKELYVQIDTSSDALWVTCKSCSGCSQNNRYYDESLSSTSYLISCSDRFCLRTPNTCSNSDHDALCSYELLLSSGTEASGYYVSDVIHLKINGTSNDVTSVSFGCSTAVAQSEAGLDGVFGFGRQGFSVINQLYTQGVAPQAFSHCLAGSDTVSGGGILVIGYPQEPKIVYTPLVPEAIHFEVYLESISVNGETLPINQSTFQQGRARIDSGTTLAYLPRGAYSYFLDAITKAVPQSVQPTIKNGNQCYLSNSSFSVRSPMVSLNFADNASMHLRPKDYLVQQLSEGDFEVWCVGFLESTNQDTILGDLVLRDKLIVYDLEGERIGWSNYDCSSYINATATAPSSGVTSEPEILLLTVLILLLHASFMIG